MCPLVLRLCGGSGIGALTCFRFPLLQLNSSLRTTLGLHNTARTCVQLSPVRHAHRNVAPGSRVVLKSPVNYGSALLLNPNLAYLLRQICIRQKNPHLFMHPTHLGASSPHRCFSTGAGIEPTVQEEEPQIQGKHWRPRVPK